MTWHLAEAMEASGCLHVRMVFRLGITMLSIILPLFRNVEAATALATEPELHKASPSLIRAKGIIRVFLIIERTKKES
jgi:hypothetical protein